MVTVNVIASKTLRGSLGGQQTTSVAVPGCEQVLCSVTKLYGGCTGLMVLELCGSSPYPW